MILGRQEGLLQVSAWTGASFIGRGKEGVLGPSWGGEEGGGMKGERAGEEDMQGQVFEG